MKTILLIDDDQDLNEIMTELLENEGYKVVTFMNGLHAFEWLTNIKPDLMLIDAKMPVIDGFTFLKKIRSTNFSPTYPVLLMSAEEPDPDTELEKECGWSFFIKKPIEFSLLTELIRKLLKKTDADQLVL